MRRYLVKTVGALLFSFIASIQVYTQNTTYARIIAAGAGGDLMFLDENYQDLQR